MFKRMLSLPPRNGTSRRRRFIDANSARPTRRHQLCVGTIRPRPNSTQAIRRGTFRRIVSYEDIIINNEVHCNTILLKNINRIKSQKNYRNHIFPIIDVQDGMNCNLVYSVHLEIVGESMQSATFFYFPQQLSCRKYILKNPS